MPNKLFLMSYLTICFSPFSLWQSDIGKRFFLAFGYGFETYKVARNVPLLGLFKVIKKRKTLYMVLFTIYIVYYIRYILYINDPIHGIHPLHHIYYIHGIYFRSYSNLTLIKWKKKSNVNLTFSLLFKKMGIDN